VDDFAALEYQLLSEREQGLESELAQWQRDAATATAQLAEARLRLVDTDAALLLRDDEVVRLRAEVKAAQAATAGAEQLAADWRHKAEQLEAERQASAALSR
jgi:chromosome segregation ATPase